MESVQSQQGNHRATQWQRFAEGCFTDSKERPNKQTVQLCLNNIAYQNYLQGNPRLCCYHLKHKKTQGDSWFYCRQIQEMLLCKLPQAVAYQGQGDKGEARPINCYKEPRILLINTVTFF